MKKLVVGTMNTYKKSSGRLWLSGPFVLYSNCKYHPTCSEYTVQAVEKYGPLKGLAKGMLRVLKCNPLSRGGVDLP